MTGTHILEGTVDGIVGVRLQPLDFFTVILYLLRWVDSSNNPKGFVSWIDVRIQLIKMTMVGPERIDQDSVQLFHKSTGFGASDFTWRQIARLHVELFPKNIKEF